MTEKKFEWWVDGLFVNTFETKYWEIIKLWLSVENLTKFMKENQNEKWFVNVDIMTARSWEKYAKLNTWKPEGKGKWENARSVVWVDDEDSDLPF